MENEEFDQREERRDQPKRPGYPHRRHYETNGTMGRLNYLYERYRVVFTLIFIPFALFLFKLARNMDSRLSNTESALEILVRSKCADMTYEQITITGLDCHKILRRPVPEEFRIDPIAPTTNKPGTPPE